MSGKSPEAWAREKLYHARSIWNETGAILARMVPLAFPGAPSYAFIGFMSNGDRAENTTDGNPHQTFHEVGFMGIEAGPRDGPAPNPNPHAPNNSWGLLHNDPLVHAMLDRDATMVPDAWKISVRDQCAVGLVNLLHHASLFSGIDALRPTPGSLWHVATAFMAWSAGSPRTAARYHAHATELAAVPESERWGAFLRIAAQAPPGPLNHSNIAYSALRTMQKLRAGESLELLLAQDAGASLSSWWDEGLSSVDLGVTIDAITRHANGEP
jgi:hypothetical protein